MPFSRCGWGTCLGSNDRFEPSEVEIRSARVLLDSVGRLSARDALHVAVMQKAGASRILSFDDGFDSLSGIERLK